MKNSAHTREKVTKILDATGREARRRKGDLPTPVEFRLLSAFMGVTGDPEKQLHSFAEGVRVGVGVKMPRVPAVYPKKKKWSLREQEDPRNHLWCVPSRGADQDNYRSAQELEEAVVEQLELSVKKNTKP